MVIDSYLWLLRKRLVNSLRCAILAPTGPQKQRILGLIFDDRRLASLEGISEFSSHAAAIRKMYMHQVLHSEQVAKFEASLAEHQRALRGDGLTIMEHAVIQHNILAVSRLYTNIYISEMARVLGLKDTDKAETMVSNMIKDGTLRATIDQVDDLLTFESEHASPILAWDDAITTMCIQLNKVAMELEAEA
jgi:COP9 signalosome complex subunit 4